MCQSTKKQTERRSHNTDLAQLIGHQTRRLLRIGPEPADLVALFLQRQPVSIKASDPSKEQPLTRRTYLPSFTYGMRPRVIYGFTKMYRYLSSLDPTEISRQGTETEEDFPLLH